MRHSITLRNAQFLTGSLTSDQTKHKGAPA